MHLWSGRMIFRKLQRPHRKNPLGVVSLPRNNASSLIEPIDNNYSQRGSPSAIQASHRLVVHDIQFALTSSHCEEAMGSAYQLPLAVLPLRITAIFLACIPSRL